ncbi:hypothetical protein ABT300_01455 [Streptomyces sp. NPDC001027]|uniref:hypothetical protein n=1 Tax=Streptomyces sp. NPDC001027 TaxID=3154771 RepID=UPI0033215E11
MREYVAAEHAEPACGGAPDAPVETTPQVSVDMLRSRSLAGARAVRAGPDRSSRTSRTDTAGLRVQAGAMPTAWSQTYSTQQSGTSVTHTPRSVAVSTAMSSRGCEQAFASRGSWPAGSEVGVRFGEHADRLRVDERDSDPRPPLPAPVLASDEADSGPDWNTGRGRLIVEALATSWGDSPSGRGTSVRCELTRP